MSQAPDDLLGGRLPPEEDPYLHYERLRRRIASLPELPMRMQVLRGMLEDLPSEVGAFVLDHFVRGSLRGDEPCQGAILALAGLLIRLEAGVDDRPGKPLLRALHEAAHRQGRAHVVALLLPLPPHREVENRPMLLQGPKIADRDVSLGERRQLAASGNRTMLEKLLMEHNPMVVRRLCANPRLRERDVISMIVRRPTLPEALIEVGLSTRWLVQYEVRRALILNPFAPAGIGMKLLPMLQHHDLLDVAKSSELHPELHASARLLVRLREVQPQAPGLA